MVSSDITGRSSLWPLAVAVILVIARSYVFVAYEHAHFDSDQAVVGLMARHLGQLQALPTFFLRSTLPPCRRSVDRCPVPARVRHVCDEFEVAPPCHECGGGRHSGAAAGKGGAAVPLQALCAVLFFVIPTPVTASRLVEAQGANIEPFLYVLLLWILRP